MGLLDKLKSKLMPTESERKKRDENQIMEFERKAKVKHAENTYRREETRGLEINRRKERLSTSLGGGPSFINMGGGTSGLGFGFETKGKKGRSSPSIGGF